MIGLFLQTQSQTRSKFSNKYYKLLFNKFYNLLGHILNKFYKSITINKLYKLLGACSLNEINFWFLKKFIDYGFLNKSRELK